MHYTATYSPDDNKLRLYAPTRLSAEDYKRVTEAGFKWAPRQTLFVAPMWTPEREDVLLELCGEIDDEDTSLRERAETRAERFDDLSEKRAAESAAAHRRVHQIADAIPFGQPILVGHHSEKRARRDVARIQGGMRKAIDLNETAKYWERRADRAIAHAKYKEAGPVRARRIKTLEAALRRMHRALNQRGEMHQDDIERLDRWADHYTMRIAYETRMLTAEGGIVTDHTGPEVGGAVQCWASGRRGWTLIVRASAKSVTVQRNYQPGGRLFAERIPHDKVVAIMTRAEVEAARAAGRVLEAEGEPVFYVLPPTPAPADQAPLLDSATQAEPLQLEALV